ncbi:MAG: hypothetical protein M1829_006008 [Trizodia sp. TS-e1964]|nr:MAG: hypothetical protein M1829_006008 [Trizodia sp. TS-e1964]
MSLLQFAAFLTCVSALPHHGKFVQKAHNHTKDCAGNQTMATGAGALNGAGAVKGAKALYFLTNAAQNSVVALSVSLNGTLSDGSITATGGAGANGIDGKTMAAAGSDPLFSQGSLKVDGNLLAAVNAGSNTVSLFKIDETDATKLTLLGTPADTLGEFPVSVALSSSLKMACVANTGAKDGIACFSTSDAGLTPLDLSPRTTFNLGQSTPPVGPTNTVSHIFFNKESTLLLTTVKGDPSNNKTGFMSVFPVKNGTLSSTETRSSPNGTAVLFGSADAGNGLILATDASFGAATLRLNAKLDARVVASAQIDGQKATCWAAISPATKTAFVTDVGVNRLVEIEPMTGKQVGMINAVNGNPGMIDLAAAGNFVYALSSGNATVKTAVAVFEVRAGGGQIREVQNFNPTGVSTSVQGMTVLV